MWIDGQNVCHTVALPDPTNLMSPVFRASFDRLRADRTADIADLLEWEEDRFLREKRLAPWSGATEREFEGVPPPSGLLRTPVETVEDLRECIQAIDERWRLDALVALDDYL
jgi:hypothetical protein